MSSESGPGSVGPTSLRRDIDRFLDRCAELIVEAADEGRIVACVLCGSFATGEGSIVEEDDMTIFLSDVDIVAVAEDLDTHRSIRARRNEIGEACEALLPGVRFAGRVDVGVLLAGEFGELPHSPGIHDMRKHGRVLRGPGDILLRIPKRAPSTIGADQALRLVENRVPPLLLAHGAAGSAGGDRWRFLYAISRVYTDIATAAICLAGRYESGYAVRASRFDGVANRGPAWKELAKPVENWTRFKLDPCRETADAAVDGLDDSQLWNRAAGDLLRFWRRLAAERAGQDPAAGEEAPLAELVETGRRGERHLANARRWATVMRSLGTAEALRAATALRERMLTTDPEAWVRRAAVGVLDARVSGGPNAVVEGLPGGFPYGRGRWDEAAKLAARRWHRLVFDREEG